MRGQCVPRLCMSPLPSQSGKLGGLGVVLFFCIIIEYSTSNATQISRYLHFGTTNILPSVLTDGSKDKYDWTLVPGS